MNNESVFEIILLILKIIIIVLWILDIYLKYLPPKYQFLDINNERFWAERVSFLFEILIAFLLIYLFNPRANRSANLDFETKMLLFILGFILLMSANWKTFIKETPPILHKIHISK